MKKQPLETFSPAWFDDCFEISKNALPADIRAASEKIVKQHQIAGICDPLYIANVTAFEPKRGDGKGMFYPAAALLESDERERLLDIVAKRLAFSYSSCFKMSQQAIRNALTAEIRL